MVIWTGISPYSFDGYLALCRDFGRISGFLAKSVSFSARAWKFSISG
jgi:hypothetical protein